MKLRAILGDYHTRLMTSVYTESELDQEYVIPAPPVSLPAWVPSARGEAALVPMQNMLDDVMLTGVWTHSTKGAAFSLFSGGIYNPHWGQLGCHVIHGGGHGAQDNSVIIADYDTLRFERVGGPTQLATLAAYDEAIMAGPDDDTNPREVSPGVPGAAHTYDTLLILPPSVSGDPKGALIRPNGLAIGGEPNVRNTGWSHAFHFSTSQWSRWSQNYALGLGPSSSYDTLRNLIWPIPNVHSTYSSVLNALSKQWENASTRPEISAYPDMVYSSYNLARDIHVIACNAVDETQTRMYWFRGDAPANNTPYHQVVFATGSLPHASWGRGTIVDVPELGRMIFYSGYDPDRYYEIEVPVDPAQPWSWVARNITGVKPSTLNPLPKNHIYKRMDYAPALKSLVWVTAQEESTKVFGGRILVIRVVEGAVQPQPVDCVWNEWGAWTPTSNWSQCVGGTQSRTEQRTRTIKTPASNGGAPCVGPTTETRTVSQACTVIPPPSGELQVLMSHALTDQEYANVVAFYGYVPGHGTTYARSQTIERVVAGTEHRLKFHGHKWVKGNYGADRNLSAPEYELFLDFQSTGTGIKSVRVNDVEHYFPISTLSPGYHWVQAKASTDEFFCPHHIFVLNADGSAPAHGVMPVMSGTYLVFFGYPLVCANVPATSSSIVAPLAPREIQPFNTALPSAQIHAESLGLKMAGDSFRPNRSKEQIWSTANVQAYDTNLRQALVDGERGAGVCRGPFWLGPSRFGGVYFLEDRRFGKIHSDGFVQTFIGWRSKDNIGLYHEDVTGEESYELFGNWAAVSGPHTLHFPWGAGFLPQSITVDPSAPPAPDGQQPHGTNPVALIADDRNNRVLRVEFDKDFMIDKTPIPAPVVTDWRINMQGAWSLDIAADGKVYVSERLANRMIECDSNGNLLRVLVSADPALAYIKPGSAHDTAEAHDVAQAKAAPICYPEGIQVVDDWIYWGQRATQEIRRVNRVSGEVQLVWTLTKALGGYIQISACKDDSFGPKHSIFYATWDGVKQAAHAISPEGNGWVEWPYHENSGNSYNSAPAVGRGCVWSGQADETVWRFTKRLPSDQETNWGAYERGKEQFYASGLNVIYGQNAESFYGLPLPWGLHGSDVDYFMHYKREH